MHPFERDAIEIMIGSGGFAPDIWRQLEHATVVRRARDAEAHVAYFDVGPVAPTVVPSHIEMAADLDVDAYGTVTACLAIVNGRLASLSFEMPGPHWPEHPRVLGLAPKP
ncbi:MAG: hypothetical protein ABJF01_24800 [bacterium]